MSLPDTKKSTWVLDMNELCDKLINFVQIKNQHCMHLKLYMQAQSLGGTQIWFGRCAAWTWKPLSITKGILTEKGAHFRDFYQNII